MSTPCRGVVAWRTLTVIGPWGVITTCGVACAATAAGRCCGTQQKNQQKNQRKIQQFFAKKLRFRELSSELRLLMSFSWLCFPGVIWTRFFSPHGFPGFWGSIPKRCTLEHYGVVLHIRRSEKKETRVSGNQKYQEADICGKL